MSEWMEGLGKRGEMDEGSLKEGSFANICPDKYKD